MSQRINVTKSVNKILVPRLLQLGFEIVGGEHPECWKEGCYFKRIRDGRQQGILFGRDKFGHALGWNIGRQGENGQFRYMDRLKSGLTLDNCRYETQQELDEVLIRFVQLLDARVVPWLERESDTDEIGNAGEGVAQRTISGSS